jgi:hypothetical protein
MTGFTSGWSTNGYGGEPAPTVTVYSGSSSGGDSGDNNTYVYTVSGSPDSAADGDYYQNGTYNNYPAYTNGSFWLVRANGGPNTWCFYATKPAADSFAGIVYYKSMSMDNSTPLASGTGYANNNTGSDVPITVAQYSGSGSGDNSGSSGTGSDSENTTPQGKVYEYAISNCSNNAVNGNYYRHDSDVNGNPCYTNGTYYMFYHGGASSCWIADGASFGANCIDSKLGSEIIGTYVNGTVVQDYKSITFDGIVFGRAPEVKFTIDYAGDSSVLGTYYEDGVHNGKPYYYNGSTYIYWNTNGYWAIANSLDGLPKYRNGGDIYDLASWSAYNAPAPTPNLSEGDMFEHICIKEPDDTQVNSNQIEHIYAYTSGDKRLITGNPVIYTNIYSGETITAIYDGSATTYYVGSAENYRFKWISQGRSVSSGTSFSTITKPDNSSVNDITVTYQRSINKWPVSITISGIPSFEQHSSSTLANGTYKLENIDNYSNSNHASYKMDSSHAIRVDLSRSYGYSRGVFTISDLYEVSGPEGPMTTWMTLCEGYVPDNIYASNLNEISSVTEWKPAWGTDENACAGTIGVLNFSETEKNN